MAAARRGSLVLALVLGIVAFGPSWASAAPIGAYMSDLLVPGASLQVGDLLFSNFQGYSSPGYGGDPATMVNPASIYVYAITVGNETGLAFQSPSFFAAPGQIQDTSFTYTVTMLDQSRKISDNTLAMIAGVNGGGRVSIIENITTPDDPNLLAQELVNVISSGGIYSDHMEFTEPLTTVTVSKDISLVGGSGNTDFASLSDFTQTFSQTPEPATLVLLGLGSAWAWRGRKRRV